MPTPLKFWKVQSVGNDFPLIHLDDVKALAISSGASEDFLYTSLAIQTSDRHTGVGGDGLLAAGMEEGDLRLRMFNPDGTEDFCGNGLRCAAWHAHLQGWIGKVCTIRHLDQKVPTTISDDGIATIIGSADYDPAKVPHTGFGELFNQTVWSGMDSGMPMSLFGSALTTGSTHVVIGTYALPDDDSFKSVSAKVEVAEQYPKRTSVIWRQEVEPMKLKIRIWERGVGETLGCGTGSAAAAADYLRQKQKGGRVQVENPGGLLYVSMDSWHAPITVEGKAEQVYSGEFLATL
ncbi:MAG: diaminopimelate epimerase [Fimbriimonas sp.]